MFILKCIHTSLTWKSHTQFYPKEGPLVFLHDDLRGPPMSVENLEELIDENHAIVTSSVGPKCYVGILSFVDKDQLEPGCAILMHNKVFFFFFLTVF